MFFENRFNWCCSRQKTEETENSEKTVWNRIAPCSTFSDETSNFQTLKTYENRLIAQLMVTYICTVLIKAVLYQKSVSPDGFWNFAYLQQAFRLQVNLQIYIREVHAGVHYCYIQYMTSRGLNTHLINW
jgi:hypothetical protein